MSKITNLQVLSMRHRMQVDEISQTEKRINAIEDQIQSLKQDFERELADLSPEARELLTPSLQERHNDDVKKLERKRNELEWKHYYMKNGSTKRDLERDIEKEERKMRGDDSVFLSDNVSGTLLGRPASWSEKKSDDADASALLTDDILPQTAKLSLD